MATLTYSILNDNMQLECVIDFCHVINSFQFKCGRHPSLSSVIGPMWVFSWGFHRPMISVLMSVRREAASAPAICRIHMMLSDETKSNVNWTWSEINITLKLWNVSFFWSNLFSRRIISISRFNPMLLRQRMTLPLLTFLNSWVSQALF